MSTKDHDLSLRGKSKTFNSSISKHDNQQYRNLNLNGIHQSSKIDPIFQSSKNNSFKKNDKRNFNAVKEEKENRWKKKKDNDTKKNKSNDSTLSLHISAYENSIEASAAAASASNGNKKDGDKGLSKSMKNAKFALTSSSSKTPKMPSPFEIPRQQQDQPSEPEIMQFLASQQLVNPNQPTASINGQQGENELQQVQNNVNEWETRAAESINLDYHQFGQSEFDRYNLHIDYRRFKDKICYAMFGSLESDAEYNEIQRCEAQRIYDAIVKASIDPIFEFGTSPACNGLEKFVNFVFSAGGLGTGAISILSMLTPVGWMYEFVLVGNFIVSAGCATYGCGRAIGRLIDKGKHGESLTDLESATLWASILATPLHFVSSLANAKLSSGAFKGRIFTSSMRDFATLLNSATFGVDGVMFLLSLTDLIGKCKKDQLSSLDVLQFSMSTFFFTHTLIQPITAEGVIKQAQKECIHQYADNMKDKDARAAFQNFYDRNRGDMTANSKVIRALINMDDRNAFFKGVGEKAAVDIGGRKGKTLLVTDAHGRTNRINPNRTFFDSGEKNVAENLQDLYNGLGIKTLDEYEINGKKIFKDCDTWVKQKFGKIFRDTAGKNKEIVDTAGILAKVLNVSDPDKFVSLIEIVAVHVKGKKGPNLSARLGDLQGAGKGEFVQGIQKDLKQASQIAKNSNLTFADPYKAVYHYRKHGADFPSKIQGDSMNFYLGAVPEKIIRDANLVNVCTFDDGTIKKTYIKPNKDFAAVIETPNKQTICTMFKNERSWKLHVSKMQQLHNNAQSISSVDVAAKKLASSLGFRQLHIYVTIEGHKKPLSEVKNLEPEIHEKIAELLMTLSSSDDEESSASDDDESSTAEDET